MNPIKFIRKMLQMPDEILKIETSVTRMEQQVKELVVDRIEVG